MDRRNFCKTTLTASLAASYPFTLMQAVNASTSIAANPAVPTYQVLPNT